MADIRTRLASVTAGAIVGTLGLFPAVASAAPIRTTSFFGSIGPLDNPCTSKIEHYVVAGNTTVVEGTAGGENVFVFESNLRGSDPTTGSRAYVNETYQGVSNNPDGSVTFRFQQLVVPLNGDPIFQVQGEGQANPSTGLFVYGPYSTSCLGAPR